MAKSTAASQTEQDPFFDVPLPENGKEVVGDVDGYWDPDKSAIRFMPISAKAFDNNNDATRASILILGKLTAPCPLYITDEDKERTYKTMPVGSSVGVWYKPGMRGLIKRCGVDCYVKEDGEKKTGKPNPMKLFKIIADSETDIIPLTEDFRDESRGRLTPFDPGYGKQQQSKVKSDTNGDVDDDDAF